MTAVIYAISYQDTGSIVSYCQLAQRDLSPAGAVQVLLDELVADGELKLSQILPSKPPTKITKTNLRVDEVDVEAAKLADFVRAPYKFVLDLSDDKAKPGDGKKKTLGTPTSPISYELLAAQDVFRVTFTLDVAANTKFFAIIDGNELPVTVNVPTKTVEFPFNTSANTMHQVFFASRGVKPFFGLKKAT